MPAWVNWSTLVMTMAFLLSTREEEVEFVGRGKKTTKEVEVEEGYKGKHGQSDKEYAASRSQGGKMISGDDKRSGANTPMVAGSQGSKPWYAT